MAFISVLIVFQIHDARDGMTDFGFGDHKMQRLKNQFKWIDDWEK